MPAMTVNVTPPDNSQGDPTHNQNMINRAEGKPPELIAGKYKTQEDLEKGVLELIKRQHGSDTNALAAFYKSLESKVGSPVGASGTPADQSNAPADGKPPQDQTPAIPNPQQSLSIDPNAAKALSDQGLDMATFETEYMTTGVLSKESYDKLEAKGYNKQLVDQYVEGRKAVHDRYLDSALSTVGGGEVYEKMVAWAAKTFTAQEIETYNKLVGSNDLGVTKMAMENLKTRFVQANGSAPNLVQSDTTGSIGSTGSYQTWAQVTADMKDPRYSKDGAFRDLVQAKLSRSKL